ncbi:MAG: 1-acyl-sn-glycerol-3-phosphate acyltransferase [Chloroflexi bacterium]|nr:1-acyl-sn-glycerol-3-phosphate acyltransferase [Chloroflexota bacterium]
MDEDYRAPLRIRFSRSLIRPLFRMIFRAISRVEISGREHAPTGGAYIIAANHVSLYDPPLALAFWPVAAEAVGASDVWQRRGQSLLVQLYGVIPVHRGEYDRRLLETACAVLRAGRPLLIAPEGGRSHAPGMRRALPGVAYLAEMSGAPVLPVGIIGTTDEFWTRAMRRERPRVVMRIGEAFHLPAVQAHGAARREQRQRNADLVMERIAALLPPEYWGVYAAGNSHSPQTA